MFLPSERSILHSVSTADGQLQSTNFLGHNLKLSASTAPDHPEASEHAEAPREVSAVRSIKGYVEVSLGYMVLPLDRAQAYHVHDAAVPRL